MKRMPTILMLGAMAVMVAVTAAIAQEGAAPPPRGPIGAAGEGNDPYRGPGHDRQQIMAPRAHVRHMLLALRDLDLTEEQKTRIRDRFEAAREAGRQHLETFRAEHRRVHEEFAEKQRELLQDIEVDVHSELTEEQREQWSRRMSEPTPEGQGFHRRGHRGMGRRGEQPRGDRGPHGTRTHDGRGHRGMHGPGMRPGRPPMGPGWGDEPVGPPSPLTPEEELQRDLDALDGE